MIELLFVACLQAAPTACEERSLVHLADTHLMQCMMRAPPRLAEWSEAHPGLTVARWRCRYAGSGPHEA